MIQRLCKCQWERFKIVRHCRFHKEYIGPKALEKIAALETERKSLKQVIADLQARQQLADL